MRVATSVLVACGLSLAPGGCGDAGAGPPDAGAALGAREEIHAIDLLFMVDNSGDMLEEQLALRAHVPRLVQALTSGDLDADGLADFPRVESLHVGVVSSDLGMPGVTGIDRCAGLGDDGVMNDAPNPDMSSLLVIEGCESRYSRFLSFEAGSDDPERFGRDAACIVMLGDEHGCGFEQQLESALKALWPADDDGLGFTPDERGDGTRGQGNGGGANDGFLRGSDDTLLVIVMLSNEDDCSRPSSRVVIPPSSLDPQDPADAALLQQGLNTRCVRNAELLHPIARYVDGFRALRPGREEQVLFTAIVGVPLETVARVPADYGRDDDARAAFYAGILEHPDMQTRIDTLGTESPDDDRVRSSCRSPSLHTAYPPLRIVQVAEAFGANGLVQSTCHPAGLVDLAPAVDAILARIAARLAGEP